MKRVNERRSFTVCKLAGPSVQAPIEMWITPDEVGLRIPLTDFLDALVRQVGNPTAIFTQAQLRARLGVAAEKIVGTMKAETTRLV